MNTERDNVKAALIEVTGGSRRNKTARLRDYYDWVMEAKAAGASNKVLVNALAKNGLIFDIDTFKHALHRLKKERAMEELVKTASTHIERRSPGSLNKPQAENETSYTGASTVKLTTQIPPKSADALDSPEGIPVAVDLTKKIFANGSLEKPPGISNSAWSEMRVKAAKDKRKK